MSKDLTFRQFEKDLIGALKPFLEDAFQGEQGKQFHISLGRFLVEGKRTQVARPTYTGAAKYTGLIFGTFAEISSSFSALRDIEVLLKATTSRRAKFSKAHVLSYHVHNFLNENYILRLRLEQFPIKVLRASKRWSTHQHLIPPIRNVLDSFFKNIERTRGGHVHDRRYSDDDLDRLSMLELLSDSNTPLGKAVYDLFKLEFADARRRWLERIKVNNDTIETLLDAYCIALYPLIFDDSGKIILPKSMSSA